MATWAEFEQQVLQLVRQIPAGRVSSYGRIAACIPPPPGMDPNGYRRIAPRKVGIALRNGGRSRAARPAPHAEAPLPWHRVLNRRGSSSLEGQAAVLQRALLEAEGVRFDATGRTDMTRYAWDFPAARIAGATPDGRAPG